MHQRLRELDGILGGEASGHVICRHKASTGDGLMTALLLLEVIADSGRTLTELVADLHRFPQKTINVRVQRNARALLQDERIQTARQAVEQALGSSGRLVLRASGTEPLIRVICGGTRQCRSRKAGQPAGRCGAPDQQLITPRHRPLEVFAPAAGLTELLQCWRRRGRGFR